jgi:ABC-type polysaccharide/polyol phosphate transport system ATPase subunit
MTTAAIRVTNLGKRYELGRAIDPARTIREAIMEGASGALRALRGRRRMDGTFWALRGVSFEVARGEAIGIIGGNGAGKSTLLKLLSRITAPTTGRIGIRGRVGSLLEVGTGFHPDLTGRENVFLNGAILGMRRSEIARKFDEIVAFAEVDRFIDTPVKRYSSGMYLRLAFAVAAHLEPEVLLVDEVLAVGDAAFQKKCLGKMGDVANEGRTVLFVSHNMDAVQRLCGRAILIQRGTIVADGGSRDIIQSYVSSALRRTERGERIDLRAAQRSGSGDARITEISYRNPDDGADGQPMPGAPLEFELVINATRALTCSSLAVSLYDSNGTKLVNADTVASGQSIQLDAGDNVVRLRIEAVHLNPGRYVAGVWMADGTGTAYDFIERAFEITLIAPGSSSPGVTPIQNGVVPCSVTAMRVTTDPVSHENVPYDATPCVTRQDGSDT